MLCTPVLLARSAWKGKHSFPSHLRSLTVLIYPRACSELLGPFFTSFPNIAESLRSNAPIRTSARSCTVLPNFIGCAAALLPALEQLAGQS